jgi:hypothetical protein
MSIPFLLRIRAIFRELPFPEGKEFRKIVIQAWFQYSKNCGMLKIF